MSDCIIAPSILSADFARLGVPGTRPGRVVYGDAGPLCRKMAANFRETPPG